MKLARLAPLFVAVLAVGALAAASSIASADTKTTHFDATGDAQSFQVPQGVTEVHVVACGAQGGVGSDQPTAPGSGGAAVTNLTVTPGETLSVMVGGKGGDGQRSEEEGIAQGGDGGFNGGANGGASIGSNDLSGGGGGGGASDVRQGGTALANRVVVAGGGGGSGAWTDDDDDFPDGPAGTGGNGGASGGDGGNERGGGGATPTTPGLASGVADYDPGLDGALGLGGGGGDGTSSNSRGGAGGGGGVYGGGGGGSGDLEAGGGGGGGSSLAPAGTITDGACTGNGFVEISYDVPDSTTTTTVPQQLPALKFTG